MKRPTFGNSTDQRAFQAMLARGKRQVDYQKLLWRMLKASMADGRRCGQDDMWRQKFIELLERVARHERFLSRTFAEGSDWVRTQHVRPKPPNLRVVRGGKQ